MKKNKKGSKTKTKTNPIKKRSKNCHRKCPEIVRCQENVWKIVISWMPRHCEFPENVQKFPGGLRPGVLKMTGILQFSGHFSFSGHFR